MNTLKLFVSVLNYKTYKVYNSEKVEDDPIFPDKKHSMRGSEVKIIKQKMKGYWHFSI